MKLFNGKIHIEDWGIHWHPYGYQYNKTKNPNDIYDYASYLYPFPNWLSKRNRYWGYRGIQYDSLTHSSVGFWFFNISWCLL